MIRDSILSLVSQSYGDFEIIAIDDGSSDSTGKILSELANLDNRIRLFSQDNIGLTRSLNRGIGYAKGKYIARLDSDDVCENSRLKLQVDYLESNPNVALLGGRAKIVDEAGTTVLTSYLDQKQIEKKMRFTNCLVHSTVMFRRSLFLEIGLYNESYETTQDYEAWSRFIGKGYAIHMLPNTLVTRNIQPASVSRKRFLLQSMNSVRVRRGRIGVLMNAFLFLHQFTFGLFGALTNLKIDKVIKYFK